MNYSEWLAKAQIEIIKLKKGTVFQIKDLFQPLEWQKLSAKERQFFGKYFSTAVKDGKIANVSKFKSEQKGANLYKKEK